MDTIVGLKLNEYYSVEQALSTLVGYAEGAIKFSALSAVRINSNGALDSLILSADSVGIRFALSGSAIVERSTNMHIRLNDDQGNLLLKDNTSILLNGDAWLSKTFVLNPEYLMGEELDLLVDGDIRELESSYLSVKDYFHLSVIIDLYD